jgi:hypothetical protein
LAIPMSKSGPTLPVATAAVLAGSGPRLDVPTAYIRLRQERSQLSTMP